jgi:hypothetical protein
MKRRWLTGLAVLALWLLASQARAHEPIPTPPVWEDSAAPAPAAQAAPPAAATPVQTPPAPPAAVVPAPPAPPAAVVPAPPALDAPRPSPGSPSVAVVPPAMPQGRVPLARRWWFWAALGGAAVGLVVGAIAISPKDPYVGNASPGLVSPIF